MFCFYLLPVAPWFARFSFATVLLPGLPVSAGAFFFTIRRYADRECGLCRSERDRGLFVIAIRVKDSPWSEASWLTLVGRRWRRVCLDSSEAAGTWDVSVVARGKLGHFRIVS